METIDLIFLSLAVLAILLPFGIEWLKRPRLEIAARPWVPSRPVPWTFAVVFVQNKPPLSPPFSWLFVRDFAASCTATLEFRRGGELAIPEIAARWSSRPEPVRPELVDKVVQVGGEQEESAGIASVASLTASGGGFGLKVQEVEWRYDPTIVPQTLALDLAPGRWEEIAVAILHQDGEAYGWGAESYAHGARNPDWKLERAVYEVTVRLQGSGISRSRTFRLDNLQGDFSRFRLASV